MSASLRSFRAAALAVVTLMAFAPSAASAGAKGYGTLIEYAGNTHKNAQIQMIEMQFMSIFGSGL